MSRGLSFYPIERQLRARNNNAVLETQKPHGGCPKFAS
jgi:hypothetical protein